MAWYVNRIVPVVIAEDNLMIAKWLEGRMPEPVDDPESWRSDEESEPIDV